MLFWLFFSFCSFRLEKITSNVVFLVFCFVNIFPRIITSDVWFCSAVFVLFCQIYTSNIQASHIHGELFSIRASALEKEEARKGGKKCFVTASGLHFKCFPLLRSVLGAGTQHVRFLRGYRTLDKRWIPQTRCIPAHFMKAEKKKVAECFADAS